MDHTNLQIQNLSLAVEEQDSDDTTLGWFARWGTRLFWGPAALILIVLAVLASAREVLFLTFGVPAQAYIASVRVEETVSQEDTASSMQRTSWYRTKITYHYRDRQGATYEGTLVQAADRVQTRYERGQRLDIEYLRYSPSTSRLLSSWWDVQQGTVLLVLVLCSGALIAGVMWLTDQQGLWIWVHRFSKSLDLRRKKNRSAHRVEFPERWEAYLQRNVGLYHYVPPELQRRLREDLLVFVETKHWEACAGLEVTEEMKVTIAAQACILLMGMEHDFYSDVRTILVYPTKFRMHQDVPDGKLVPTREVQLLGQAWRRGPVILAWDEVLIGGRNPRDGRNVVFHEFAHQLDFMGELGHLTEVPLEKMNRWRRVIRSEHQRLVEETKVGHATVLDAYGAQSEREFFAVATECFFTRPRELRASLPDLYEVLRDYYGMETALWSAGSNRIDQYVLHEG